jgi:hypothetical protein
VGKQVLLLVQNGKSTVEMVVSDQYPFDPILPSVFKAQCSTACTMDFIIGPMDFGVLLFYNSSFRLQDRLCQYS